MQRRRQFCFSAAAFAVALASAPERALAQGADGYDGEVARLSDAMAREVGDRPRDGAAADAEWMRMVAERMAASGRSVLQPELVVSVDSNTAVQEIAVVAVHPDRARWAVLGRGRVSTGQVGRFDHYVTPVGVFLHDGAILGYRAQGTPNESGIRGLGARGMRVWDLGWHKAQRGWGRDRSMSDIRFMLHATDPAALEPRLGRVNSKGCVRMSSAMNRFLDGFGVLDRDYERLALDDRRYAGLLRRDRTPTPLAGNAVVVFDSATG